MAQFMFIGGRNIRIEFQGSFTNGANASSYTYTSAPIGDAVARRWVLAGVGASQLGANLNAPDSCSIAGIGASLVVQNTASGTRYAQFWIAAVPAGSGTTGNVTFARSGGLMDNGLIAVWAAYDLISATAFATNAVSIGVNPSCNVNTQSGGVVLALGYNNSGTISVSGVTTDTTVADFGVAGSNSKTPAATPRSISFGGTASCVSASFR